MRQGFRLFILTDHDAFLLPHLSSEKHCQAWRNVVQGIFEVNMLEKSDYACGHRHVRCVLVCINQYVHVDDLDPEGAVPLPFLLRCEYPRVLFWPRNYCRIWCAEGCWQANGLLYVNDADLFTLTDHDALFLPHLSSERDCLSMETYWPRSSVRSPNGGTQLGVALHSAAAVCHLVRGTVATMLVLFNVLRGVRWHLEGSASRIQTFHSYGP